jgi:TonB family protein
MIMLWIAAAVAQPPKPINEANIITRDDYPGEAIQAGSYGLVSMHLEITRDGRVGTCAVSETSGSRPLDHQACRVVKTRARFEPARDAAGQAVPSDYRMAVVFGLGEHMPSTTTEMAMDVAIVPADYRQPVKASIVFGADGHATQCDIRQSSGSAAADRGVCAAITRQMTIPPPKSGSREPAAAARFYIVSLVAAPHS